MQNFNETLNDSQLSHNFLLVGNSLLNSCEVIIRLDTERRIKLVLVFIDISNLTFISLNPVDHFHQYPVNFVLALTTLAETRLRNF